MDLYLSLDYAPPLHMETRFMNACQAAEGYHRATSTGTVMDPEEHKKIVGDLLAVCPENRRQWLGGVLANSNDPSFKRRIEELVERAGSAVRKLMVPRPKYAVKMRDYRNTFAHWLSTEPPTDDLGAELHDLIRVTRFVLASCLLRDLGWSASDAESALAQNQLFDQAVRDGRSQK
jgi:hypothetical protein